MNILFDLDGTLTDPQEGIVTCIRYALEKLSRNPDEYANLQRFIGPPLLASFEELLGCAAEAESALQLYRDRFSAVGLFENHVYDGIEESLDALAAHGHRMLVATAKPRVFALRILEHFGLASYFTGIYGSELDGRLSDKAELIAHIVQQEQLEPATTLMIGDRSYDIVGAKANALRSIGVLWGYGSRAELSRAAADALCESPPDLFPLINSIT